jgi:hypothetical protein
MEHCRRSNRNAHKYCWIKSLQKIGLRPVIKLLETVESDDENVWQERERFWIAKFRSEGARLTNEDSGGWGGKQLSAATRSKLSEINKGKKHSAETRARISQAKRNPSLETRALMSASHIGKKLSMVQRKKISVSSIGHVKTAEHRANLSKALTGIKRSPETIEKTAAKNRGRKLSAETCQKMSNARKGKSFPESFKKTVSVAITEWWRQRKLKSNVGQLNLL